MASDGYMKKIQASLKMVFYVSTLLYLLGKGIGFITHHLNSLISRSSSQGHTDTNTRNTRNNATYNQYFTLQVPVPYIDIKKLFGSSNDDSLSSSDQPKRIKGQYTVEYLNSMARRIDFLHQNYVRYLNKLTNDNTVMMMSSTTTAATDSTTTFQKRIRPIVFKNKFNLAKDILMRDLNDTIVKCQWKTEMCRQQIKTVSKFIPPSFFLMDPKLSPYYWVLTDIDYKLMPPFLRNFVLYTNTSNINSTFNNAGLFGSTSTGYDGRMNPLQFSNNLPPTTTMFGNSSSSIIGGVPSQVVDRIRYDWKFFITQNRSISHRFEFLYNAFLTKQGLTVQNKQDRKNYLKEFENDCYKLLKKRRKVARNKIKTVRMKHLRPSEREKSQLKAQYNKLKQIELENRRFI